MAGQLEAMQLDGDELKGMEAIVLSMTPQERMDPSVIEASRRRRIARGCGKEAQDVSGLVKQFTQASHMMKQMAGMGARQRMGFAQQLSQMGPNGMGKYKVKQRSKRLSKKERAKRRKRRR